MLAILLVEVVVLRIISIVIISEHLLWFCLYTVSFRPCPATQPCEVGDDVPTAQMGYSSEKLSYLPDSWSWDVLKNYLTSPSWSGVPTHIQPATISELRKASFWHSAGASPPEKFPKFASPAISLCKHTFCSCEWNPLTGMVSALIIGSPACAKRKLVSVHLSRFQIGFCESPAWGKEARFSSGKK